jgi:hypothetical protein
MGEKCEGGGECGDAGIVEKGTKRKKKKKKKKKTKKKKQRWKQKLP